MKIKSYFSRGLFTTFTMLVLFTATSTAADNGRGSGSWDYIPPTAVCDDRLNVSLTSAGSALIYAEAFDEGSYDNYCLASVKVRRMDQPYAPFANSVIFTCDDIGQLVSVELQARDCAGNTNSCWSEVWVEDKIGPQIHCPYNKTIPCNDLNNWYAMGQASATDNCGVANVTFYDVDNTNSCGTGYITRRWKATDIYGNMSMCDQTIHIIDTTPVVVLFPPDTTFHDCITADDLDPQDLPAPYSQPIVLYEDCELMAFSHEDWVFTASQNSCLKIIRRWKVINWCTYQYGGDVGIWEDTQILKIQDNTPPVITCPDNIVKPVGANCTATVTMPPLATVDDCLSDINIRIMGDLGEGSTFTSVPPGEYNMTYVAKDGCLNTSSCSIRVSVVDAAPPGVVCRSSVSFPLMANGEAMLWASDLEQGSSADNCTAYGNLEFRLGLEPAPGQVSPPDEDFVTFTCADTGANIVALWVGDEAGNWDYCLATAIVQDNQNVCGPLLTRARIAGLVTDEQGDEVPGAVVHIDSTASGAYEATVDSLGWYAFEDMPTGASYLLRPEKESEPLAGVTTVDLILLAKHVMEVDTLDTPYQFIAADIDGSGVVDMDDLGWLHRMLLGMEVEFPDSISWLFVPKSFVFPAIDPLSVDFPEELAIDNLSGHREDAHFIAVKRGDLDASLMIPADSVQNRSVSLPFALETTDRYLQEGERVAVRLSLRDQETVLGLFLTLEHEGLALEEVLFDGLPGSGAYRAGKGQSAISWAGDQNRSLEAGQALLTLRFKAERAGLLNGRFTLGREARAFRTDSALEGAPVTLRFKTSKEAFQLVSAYPNPFRDKAFLAVDMPETGWVRFSAWDARGALVHQEEWLLEAGRHERTVNAAELGGAGAYLFRLDSASGEASGRLVVLP